MDNLKKLWLWVSIIAGLLIIGGQIMTFFVNLYTLKEIRLQKQLKQNSNA